MSETPTRRAGVTLAIVLLLALVAADVFALLQLAAPGAAEALAGLRSAAEQGRAEAAVASALESGMLPWLLIPTVGPLVVLLALLIGARGGAKAGAGVGAGAAGAETAVERKDAAAPRLPPEASGLKLLATLQEEARLVDFVREDITAYSDEQVGAAVRGIHAALRKALDERLDIAPILAGEEGDEVEVPGDLPPDQLRLTGRPPSAVPFRGVLRHAGWRAVGVRLPSPTPGSDPAVLAPAEVEVGEG